MHKRNLVIIALLLPFISGWFYWFQWRPSAIRRDCAASAKELAVSAFKKRVELNPSATTQDKNQASGGAYMPNDRDSYYKICLIESGLEK